MRAKEGERLLDWRLLDCSKTFAAVQALAIKFKYDQLKLFNALYLASSDGEALQQRRLTLSDACLY